MIFLEAIDLLDHLHGDYNPQITKTMGSFRIVEQNIRVENDNFIFHWSSHQNVDWR